MIRAAWDQGFKRSYKKRVRNNSRLKKSQETNTPNSGIVATFHMPPFNGIYPSASLEHKRLNFAYLVTASAMAGRHDFFIFFISC